MYGSRPSEDYEDPDDVAAIQEAHNNMGDYKLKSADDYVVPDHLRMNADKAKFRLLVIKDLVGVVYSWAECLIVVFDGVAGFILV